MKKLIFLTTILYLALVASIGLLGHELYRQVTSLSGEKSPPEERHVIYRISDYKGVVDYIWINNERLVFIADKKLITYSTKDRLPISTNEIPMNSKLGFENDNLWICQWENRIITDPMEFSTTLRVYDGNHTLISELQLHPTVQPITCSNDGIVLQANYPGAPDTFYKLTVSDSQIYEIAQGKYKLVRIEISGSETTKFVYNGDIHTIQKVNNFISAEANLSGGAFALLDGNGFLWVYQKD